MIDNLHRWLILRLAAVWLVLSVLIGGLVHYFGNARLDNHVVNMAETEAANYSAEFTTYLGFPSGQTLALLNRKIHDIFDRGNFIVVEFYDAGSNKIAEVVKPSAKAVETRLPKHTSDFARKGGVLCQKMMVGNETYLRVFVPIYSRTGTKLGYMEGIYHAPEEIITQIKRQTLWSLILLVLVIFVTSLALYPLIIRLNRKLIDYSHILAQANIGMLEVLGSAIAKRDSDTNIHNYRVTIYSVRLGEKLGLSNTAMQGLIKGAFLHDVGKIAITDSILLKSGKLTDEEFEIMKTHVRHGEDIVSSYDWLKDAVDVVRCHHEKFDGSGYLGGLTAEAIPLNARIFAVADVFDALTSRRPYKKPFSFDVSTGIIRESRGTHFDPAIANLFLEHAASFYKELCHEDEGLLRGKLGACIRKYFG